MPASDRPMTGGREIDITQASRALSGGSFNLIRRGADGSLVLSADKWRAVSVSDESLRFDAEAPDAAPLELALGEVERITWDRLPKQQVRSQVRFYLRCGDLWTFSGSVNEDAIHG